MIARDPMEPQMSDDLMFENNRFSRKIRYVIVNRRRPLSDEVCALCGGEFKQGYAREFPTTLLYCDRQCLERHASIRFRAAAIPARRAS